MGSRLDAESDIQLQGGGVSRLDAGSSSYKGGGGVVNWMLDHPVARGGGSRLGAGTSSCKGCVSLHRIWQTC